MIIPVLDERELEIYKLHFVQGFDIETISNYLGIGQMEVKDLVSVIEKKRRTIAGSSSFKSLITSFRASLNTVRSSLIEDKLGKTQVFNIDYSVVHVRTNPTESRVDEKARAYDLASLGDIFFMFESKLGRDKYCLLPPYAVEVISHLQNLAKYFDDLSSYKYMTSLRPVMDFCELVSNPPIDSRIFELKLKKAYYRMGGLDSLFELANERKLGEHIRRNICLLEKMRDAKKLVPIDEVVGKRGDWSKNETVYTRVLSYLNNIRGNKEINNRVDALSAAITYGLMEQYYESNNLSYRIVSNSPRPMEAFRQITWRGKPFDRKLACRPRCMTCRILVNRDVATNLRLSTIDDKISYLDECLGSIDHILNNLNIALFPMRFASDYIWTRKEISWERGFMPIYGFLKDFLEFERKYFNPYVKKALEINSSCPRSLAKDLVLKTKTLKELFSDANAYERAMTRAANDIRKSISDTYRVLYRFANRDHKNLLDKDMLDVLERL